MENIYVIKVKTKPPLSSLYPSERRYSASTVGGLSLVHFGLGALSLLLGTLALSLQGPVLSIACLVPFVTGLLAWRRWYIDRNIAIFFYSNVFSLVVAVLCFVVTIFDVTAASGNPGRSLWPLEKILNRPSYFHYPPKELINDTHLDDAVLSKNNSFNATDKYDFLKINESDKTSTVIEPSSPEFNQSNFHDIIKNSDYDDLKAEASFIFEERAMISKEIFRDENTMNITQRYMNSMKEMAKTLWHGHYQDSSHTKLLLTLNILVASLLEAFWSLLSAKIAFRGMMNRMPENSNVVGGSKITGLPLQKRKPPAPKPDILDHDRRLSETLQKLTTMQGFAGPTPRLPLPESNREFRERVEKFLSNQATHRIVEGA